MARFRSPSEVDGAERIRETHPQGDKEMCGDGGGGGGGDDTAGLCNAAFQITGTTFGAVIGGAVSTPVGMVVGSIVGGLYGTALGNHVCGSDYP